MITSSKFQWFHTLVCVCGPVSSKRPASTVLLISLKLRRIYILLPINHSISRWVLIASFLQEQSTCRYYKPRTIRIFFFYCFCARSQAEIPRPIERRLFTSKKIITRHMAVYRLFRSKKWNLEMLLSLSRIPPAVATRLRWTHRRNWTKHIFGSKRRQMAHASYVLWQKTAQMIGPIRIGWTIFSRGDCALPVALSPSRRAS